MPFKHPSLQTETSFNRFKLVGKEMQGNMRAVGLESKPSASNISKHSLTSISTQTSGYATSELDLKVPIIVVQSKTLGGTYVSAALSTVVPRAFSGKKQNKNKRHHNVIPDKYKCITLSPINSGAASQGRPQKLTHDFCSFRHLQTTF